MDRNRLIKLLNLSASENDHEALIAIRMANEMVGHNWDDVIIEASAVDCYAGSVHDALRETQEIVGRTLDVIRLNQHLLDASGLRWFGIMERNFTSHKILSDRQLNVLQGIFEDVKRKIMWSGI
jgi:hypothetical protein